MRYTDIELIRCKMNECGENRTPFLFIVDFELTEGYFIENPREQSAIYFQVGEKGNKPRNSKERHSLQGKLEIDPLSPEDYKSRFDIVQEGLRRGDSFLTNLTVRTPIKTALSLSGIFQKSRARYQLLVPGHFVCFSPEQFVSVEGTTITTCPMKGTMDATLPGAEELLLADFKETAEHSTVVDLLRNDLSMNAGEVHVKRSRYIDRIRARGKDILQVSSEIVGKLPGESCLRFGDIVFRMLPAGSVSGAPKPATVRLIQRAEKEPRGYYTGVFGYFDGQKLDSAVMIRFIEERNGRLFFRSGGGITAYSRWESEYREVLDKIYLPFP